MERRTHYLFVDLDYLGEGYRSFAERWFQGEGGIDFDAFYRHAHAPAKTFYYGGEPAAAWVERVRSAPGAHLRSAPPGGGGRAGMAVQATVDLLQHATRGKMTHATLLSGDAVFAPVVRALVEIGADVTVWGEPATVAPALRHAADHFLPLRWQDHHHWTEERIASTALLPGLGSGVASKLEGSRESHARGGWALLESGTVGAARHRADLWGMDAPVPTQYSLAVEQRDAPEPAHVLTVSHSDRTLLLRYAEMEWGAVNLAPVEE